MNQNPFQLGVRVQKQYKPLASRRGVPGFPAERGFSVDVEFQVAPGITVLFGPSGSGKSTILECIAGLLNPDSGQIHIGETTLYSSHPAVRVPVRQRGLGYVFQTLALFPHFTVRENVEYGLHRLPLEERRARSSAVLESLHIAHLSQQRPDRISGGERQRVALARSLVTYPRALLLDEPLSALDFETKAKIMDDLKAWNREHRIPVLYVTHALDEVFALGERVVAIRDGRVVNQGTPAEVLRAERGSLLAQLASV